MIVVLKQLLFNLYYHELELEIEIEIVYLTNISHLIKWLIHISWLVWSHNSTETCTIIIEYKYTVLIVGRSLRK